MEEGADEEHGDGRGRFPIAHFDDGDVQVPETKKRPWYKSVSRLAWPRLNDEEF